MCYTPVLAGEVGSQCGRLNIGGETCREMKWRNLQGDEIKGYQEPHEVGQLYLCGRPHLQLAAILEVQVTGVPPGVALRKWILMGMTLQGGVCTLIFFICL